MEIYLICLAVALIGGLLMSRVTKLLNLPALTKRSLTLVGEIIPEGKTSARVTNKPKPPVNIP